MKLKQHPDDFRVEELTDVVPGESGTHTLYRLEKTGWTTPDALAAVRKRWRLERRRVSYGGLKDRHAHTVQHFTILRGPRRHLTHQSIRVTCLGQVDRPFASSDIRGNRFRIVMRALDRPEIEYAERGLKELGDDGVPNYFDDQRFGSSRTGPFVALLMIQGRYEDSVREALTAPYEFDSARHKREKSLLRRHWGDWQTCRQKMLRGDARQVVEYLAESPHDFQGAITRISPEMRSLYLSAYQSHLWNRMLARWLPRQLQPNQIGTIALRVAELPVQRQLTAKQRETLSATTLPLPSARAHLPPADARLALMEAVLLEDGITLKQMQFKGRRDMFFSKGERAVLCIPVGLRHEIGEDERNSGRSRLTLSFDLPRGSYATLIVKRLTACRFPV
jgi:tRNA pseudouridine13 synthase